MLDSGLSGDASGSGLERVWTVPHGLHLQLSDSLSLSYNRDDTQP